MLWCERMRPNKNQKDKIQVHMEKMARKKMVQDASPTHDKCYTVNVYEIVKKCRL